MGREIAHAPAEVKNVKLEGSTLKWSTNGNVRSVVYHFPDLKKPANVVAVTDKNQLQTSQPGYYSVSTINVDNKESTPSKPVEKK